jgi:uncharacterized protein YecT (DUF1311 family)
MKKYFALTLFVASINIAQAEPQYSETYTQCLDKAAGVTTAVIGCTDTELKAQDKKLNDNYKALKDKLKAPRQKQLQEVQRAWLKYRDSNCAFYADPDGGSMQRILAVDCVLKATAERAEELNTLATLAN